VITLTVSIVTHETQILLVKSRLNSKSVLFTHFLEFPILN